LKDLKRILVLTSTFPRWKDDEDPPFVFELCKRLKAHYQIHVLAPHCPGTKTEEYLSGIYIKRFRYFIQPWERLAYQGGILSKLKRHPWQYGLLPFFFLGELLSLIRLIRRHRFHLIHAHWLIPQGLVALLARLFIKSFPPLLCTSHGGDLFAFQGYINKMVKRLIVTNSTAVTVVSHAMHNEVIKLNGNHDKVYVIPMGVDLHNRFYPPAKLKNNGSLLFVGRLVEKKGLRYLLYALPLILKKHPKACLRVAGDGPEKDELKSQCIKMGISEHVHFLGAVKNDLLPTLYQESNVVVFPSVIAEDGDQEGFGLVLVEALGSECAVVVTDLPALRDIINDGKTGLVVAQKNIQKIAENVILLLNDYELGRSLGREGRSFVLKHYDWSIIEQKYVDLIESIAR
jgi:glycosyltransferase involved in cell wall biosynthesis